MSTAKRKYISLKSDIMIYLSCTYDNDQLLDARLRRIRNQLRSILNTTTETKMNVAEWLNCGKVLMFGTELSSVINQTMQRLFNSFENLNNSYIEWIDLQHQIHKNKVNVLRLSKQEKMSKSNDKLLDSVRIHSLQVKQHIELLELLRREEFGANTAIACGYSGLGHRIYTTLGDIDSTNVDVNETFSKYFITFLTEYKYLTTIDCHDIHNIFFNSKINNNKNNKNNNISDRLQTKLQHFSQLQSYCKIDCLYKNYKLAKEKIMKNHTSVDNDDNYDNTRSSLNDHIVSAPLYYFYKILDILIVDMKRVNAIKCESESRVPYALAEINTKTNKCLKDDDGVVIRHNKPLSMPLCDLWDLCIFDFIGRLSVTSTMYLRCLFNNSKDKSYPLFKSMIFMPIEKMKSTNQLYKIETKSGFKPCRRTFSNGGTELVPSITFLQFLIYNGFNLVNCHQIGAFAVGIDIINKDIDANKNKNKKNNNNDKKMSNTKEKTEGKIAGIIFLEESKNALQRLSMEWIWAYNLIFDQLMNEIEIILFEFIDNNDIISIIIDYSHRSIQTSILNIFHFDLSTDIDEDNNYNRTRCHHWNIAYITSKTVNRGLYQLEQYCKIIEQLWKRPLFTLSAERQRKFVSDDAQRYWTQFVFSSILKIIDAIQYVDNDLICKNIIRLLLLCINNMIRIDGGKKLFQNDYHCIENNVYQIDLCKVVAAEIQEASDILDTDDETKDESNLQTNCNDNKTVESGFETILHRNGGNDRNLVSFEDYCHLLVRFYSKYKQCINLKNDTNQQQKQQRHQESQLIKNYELPMILKMFIENRSLTTRYGDCFGMIYKCIMLVYPKFNIHQYCDYGDYIQIKCGGKNVSNDGNKQRKRSSRTKQTLLMYATQCVVYESDDPCGIVLKYLIKNNKYINKMNYCHQTALIKSYSKENLYLMKLILDNGGNVNDKVYNQALAKSTQLIQHCVHKSRVNVRLRAGLDHSMVLSLILSHNPKIQTKKWKIWKCIKEIEMIKFNETNEDSQSAIETRKFQMTSTCAKHVKSSHLKCVKLLLGYLNDSSKI